MKPAVLERGGKSANIVFEDADLDVACQIGTTFALIALSGQGCAFATRMLVHEDVYDEVVARVKMVAENIPSGDPFDPAVASGPVVNQAAVDRILGMIDRPKSEGATLLAGGQRVDREGSYTQPNAFTDATPNPEP